jgi:hypothetical protein
MAVIALGTQANPLVWSTTPDLKTTQDTLPPIWKLLNIEEGFRRRRHRHQRGHRDPGHGRRPQGRGFDQ